MDIADIEERGPEIKARNLKIVGHYTDEKKPRLISSKSPVNPSASNKLVTLADPDSFVSDRYRLLFSKIDLLCIQKNKKMIAITSAIKGEGKSTIISNLAVTAARDFGKRSLIVDGDFRNPSIARYFGIPDRLGLLNVITGDVDFKRIVNRDLVKDLAILPMGKTPDGGGLHVDKKNHIWTSDKMKTILAGARNWFDYIWVDAPPVLPLYDMSVISEVVDGVLFIVKSGETKEETLIQAAKSLGTKKIIGSVLNAVKGTWSSKYYDYDLY